MRWLERNNLMIIGIWFFRLSDGTSNEAYFIGFWYGKRYNSTAQHCGVSWVLCVSQFCHLWTFSDIFRLLPAFGWKKVGKMKDKFLALLCTYNLCAYKWWIALPGMAISYNWYQHSHYHILIVTVVRVISIISVACHCHPHHHY